MSTSRSQLLEEPFTQAPGEIAGLKLRPFSLGSLSLCRKLKLTLLTGDASQEQIDENEMIKQISTFLFIQSRPVEEVLRAIKSREFYDEHVLPFSLDLPMASFQQTLQEIMRIVNEASAAYVEVLPKPGEKAEDLPPNS
ncbi:MAG: hypothetical protein ACFUZC_16590 [Chthoniobacteraceae bacterium]